jgi:hypothetical protein
VLPVHTGLTVVARHVHAVEVLWAGMGEFIEVPLGALPLTHYCCPSEGAHGSTPRFEVRLHHPEQLP